MIMFAPKYRGQVIYGKIKKDIGKILPEYVKNQRTEDMVNDRINIQEYVGLHNFCLRFMGKREPKGKSR